MRGKLAKPAAVARALGALEARDVQALVVGGIAGAVYGGKSVTKALDLHLRADPHDIARLRPALDDLEARVIAVPTELRWDYLERGFWVHLECHRSDVAGLHLDVATRPFGAAPFEEMWARRLTRQLPGTGVTAHFASLPDLVALKKTRRKDDWSTIQQLVDIDYRIGGDKVERSRVRFWLLELRSAQTLMECAARFGSETLRLVPERPLLELALSQDAVALADAMDEEERLARRADEARMAPILAELERLRHDARPRGPGSDA